MRKIILIFVLFLGISSYLDKTDTHVKSTSENNYLAKSLTIMKEVGDRINNSKMLYATKISLDKFIDVTLDGLSGFDKKFFEPLIDVLREY